MKGKIAFLNGPKDLEVKEVEIPQLSYHQILVKVHACGICGSDVECYEGNSAEGRYDIAPYTPGHEWAGEVIDVGKETINFKIGDKVTSDCVLDCGYCRNCKLGKMPSACENMREVGFRPDSPGGMGEYLIINERYAHKIPDDWSYELGALIEPFSVGYFGIWGNNKYIDASDTAIINGAGMIGLSALIVAKAANAKVIVIEPLENRWKLAIKYGADEVINPIGENLKEKINKLTDGLMGSVIVECSGNDAAIASVFDIAGHSARIGLVGHSVGRKIPVEIGMTIWKTLSITGAGGTKNFMPRTIKFMDRIKDKVDFINLVSHRFPFEKIHDAFEIAVKDKKNALKVMINFK